MVEVLRHVREEHSSGIVLWTSLPVYFTTTTSTRTTPMEKNRTSRDQAVAGLVAGSATVALLHPLDVIKTRLQVQDGTGPVPASRGMVEMGRKLWSSGRLRALYAGTSRMSQGCF